MKRGLAKLYTLLTGRSLVKLDNLRGSRFLQVESCQISNLSNLYEKFLGYKTDGFFVEIGAFDGTTFSNSYGLAKAGWRGLLVEPIPEFAELARRNHEDYPGVKIIQTAVGPPGQESVFLSQGHALTSGNAELVREYGEASWSRQIQFHDPKPFPSQTLDSLLGEQGAPKNFDVLVVDVEGFEAEVFRGFTLSAWRPKMMIVELTDTHPDLATTEEADSLLMLSILREKYVVVYKDAVNTVFVDQTLYSQAYSKKA